jgi:hypothetical protein
MPTGARCPLNVAPKRIPNPNFHLQSITISLTRFPKKIKTLWLKCEKNMQEYPTGYAMWVPFCPPCHTGRIGHYKIGLKILTTMMHCRGSVQK